MESDALTAWHLHHDLQQSFWHSNLLSADCAVYLLHHFVSIAQAEIKTLDLRNYMLLTGRKLPHLLATNLNSGHAFIIKVGAPFKRLADSAATYACTTYLVDSVIHLTLADAIAVWIVVFILFWELVMKALVVHLLLAAKRVLVDARAVLYLDIRLTIKNGGCLLASVELPCSFANACGWNHAGTVSRHMCSFSHQTARCKRTFLIVDCSDICTGLESTACSSTPGSWIHYAYRSTNQSVLTDSLNLYCKNAPSPFFAFARHVTRCRPGPRCHPTCAAQILLRPSCPFWRHACLCLGTSSGDMCTSYSSRHPTFDCSCSRFAFQRTFRHGLSHCLARCNNFGSNTFIYGHGWSYCHHFVRCCVRATRVHRGSSGSAS